MTDKHSTRSIFTSRIIQYIKKNNKTCPKINLSLTKAISQLEKSQTLTSQSTYNQSHSPSKTLQVPS